MIDVKDAVTIAVDYFLQLFGPNNGLRLEEVELSANESIWLITVGFEVELPLNGSTIAVMQRLAHGGASPTERKYKVVSVDAESGTVRAVKMRQPLERVS